MRQDPFYIPPHLVAKYPRLRLDDLSLTAEERMGCYDYRELLDQLETAIRLDLPNVTKAAKSVLRDFVPFGEAG